eukprot:TRINITY_DN3531_c0_g1_i9.p1 TRINITY_DN3531_c0_g1~~TRINITY_DN3531_c0_g1_i9.p1  ORF type:complete len:459 (-),score=100.64 TRINITY_DN3531_c0_g1_i9:303-1679(-)
MLRILLLVCGVAGVPLQQYESPFEWGYQDDNGPSCWGKYYPECNKISQSPIALPTYFADHPFLRRLEYHNFDLDCDLVLYNDGKSVTMVVKDDGKRGRPSVSGSVLNPKSRYLLDRVVIKVGRDNFGSEHGMHGIHYPGEMQWYFFDEKFKTFDDAVKNPGAIAIISQLLKSSKVDNKFFDCIVDNVDKISGTKVPVDLKWLDLPELLPRYGEDKKGNKECVNCDYYFYEGSLTYPPCSEVALWHVYMDPVKVSESQLDKLRSVVSWQSKECMVDYVRGAQPVNFRDVLQHRERSEEFYSDHPNLPPKMPEHPLPFPQFPMKEGALPPFPGFPGKDLSPPHYSAEEKVEVASMPEYWPQDKQQYPTPDDYPFPTEQYPASSQQYPASGQQYPASSQQYPASSQQYPMPNQPYPSRQQYPVPVRQYPAERREYPERQHQSNYPEHHQHQPIYPPMHRSS